MLTIVSGGQTGVDRAALDVAIEQGIRVSRLVPERRLGRGSTRPSWRAGPLSGLRETPDADPRQRTEWNVRDCDRLMVLVNCAGLPVSKGTEFALACAKALAKPHIVIDIDAGDAEHLATDFLSKGRGPWRCASPARAKARPPAFMPRRRHF